MPKTFVHVNSHTIRKNKKENSSLPPITMRRGRSGKAIYGNPIKILDENGKSVAEVGYYPESPLNCGASVYIICEHGAETKSS